MQLDKNKSTKMQQQFFAVTKVNSEGSWTFIPTLPEEKNECLDSSNCSNPIERPEFQLLPCAALKYAQ